MHERVCLGPRGPKLAAPRTASEHKALIDGLRSKKNFWTRVLSEVFEKYTPRGNASIKDSVIPNKKPNVAPIVNIKLRLGELGLVDTVAYSNISVLSGL